MNLVRFHRPVNRFYTNNLVNDLFDQIWNTDREEHTCRNKPASNIFETENEFKVELLVPGYSKDEIEISVEKDTLIIKSEVENKNQDEYKYSRVEFVKNGFEKRYQLSETLDSEAISAKFENGILTVLIPKKEEEKQNILRKIEIA